MSPRIETLQPLWAACARTWSPRQQKSFHDDHEESPVFVPLYLLQSLGTTAEAGFLFSPPSLWVLRILVWTLQGFSRLALEADSVLHMRDAPEVCQWPLTRLSPVCLCLSYWRAQNWARCSTCGFLVLTKALGLLAALPYAAWDTINLPCLKGPLVCYQLDVHPQRALDSVLPNVLSNPLPQQALMHGVVPSPWGWDVALPFEPHD